MSLAALQERFLAAVLDEAPIEGVAPAEAIEVYRRNARANYRAALAAAYPVVCRLVGEAFFAEASRRFTRAHASASGDLHGYGAGFAAFLGGYAPARALDCLCDVARLEWALHESFHAADAPGLDFAALARIPAARQGELRFRLAPHVRLVRSHHAILAIWEANQPDRDGTPERVEGPGRVVVFREDGESRPHAIDESSWRFLEALGRGASLEAASDALGAQAQSQLPALLARWTSAGVIGSFEAAQDCA